MPAKKKAAKKPAKKAGAKKKTGAKKKAKKAAPKKKSSKLGAARKATKSKATRKAAPKKPAKKRAPNPAFMRPMTISADLGAVVGSTPMPRTEVTKRIWRLYQEERPPGFSESPHDQCGRQSEACFRRQDESLDV